jgi:hypothetical protein
MPVQILSANIPPLQVFLGLMVAVACVPSPLYAADAKTTVKGAKITYDDNVRPIFRDKCFACHNTEKKTAGLDLTTYAGVKTGGGSGAVIEPGDSGGSYLFSLVSHTSEPHMPPKSDKLPDDVLATISKWIDGGALENSGSKAAAPKKPKIDLALKSAPTGRPEGPPPMPEGLSLEPVVRTSRATAARTVATSLWSPLAAVAGQKQVLLYNTKTLDLAGVLPFPEGIPYVLKFSQNGLLLLAGGGHSAATGRVVVWNVKTGERVFEVGEELDAVLGADICADQTLIALGGPGKLVRVFSTADGSRKYEMKKHTDWIYSAAYSPDGVLLATADRGGGIVIWEAQTGREFLVLPGHPSAVTALSWRIDSNILASGSEDGSIKLWEMENGTQVKTWGAHGGGVTSLDFTRDGRLVSCGRDRVAKLWDQNGAAKTAFSGFTDIPLCVAYCDETNRLIAGDWTGDIKVFDAASGKLAGSLGANPPTLAERLDEAAKRFARQSAEHKTLSQQLIAAQSEAEKQRVVLDAVKKIFSMAEADWKSATAAAAKAKAVVDQFSAELNAATQTVTALKPILPVLKEAAEKSTQAAIKVAGDKELAAAAEHVKTQYTKKTAQLGHAERTVTEKNPALAKARAELVAAEKRLAQFKTPLDSAKARLAEVGALANRADVKVKESQANRDAAAQSIVQAQRDERRWQEEIVLTSKLKSLAAEQSQLAQLADSVHATQMALETAKGDVAKLAQGVLLLQKEADAAAAALKKAQELPGQLATEQESLSKHARTLDVLMPALGETLAKAEEAARRVPNDADVTGQVQQINSLIAKKTAELDFAKKSGLEKGKAIEAAKAQIPAAEKKLADLKAAIEAATKKVADATAALKPFEDKVAAAKTAMSERNVRVEAAKKEIDALKRHRAT